MLPLILGVSGASGITLAFKALSILTEAGQSVELVMTKDAQVTAAQEMGPSFFDPKRWLDKLSSEQASLVRVWKNNDFFAPIASGSFLTRGMMIVPSSMATLAAIACGLSDNLLRRAADVTLKEGRKLLICPRESPLNAIHLENMLKLSRLGVVIHPPVPAWYAHPANLEEAENYMVYRILDPFMGQTLRYERWGKPSEEELVSSVS